MPNKLKFQIDDPEIERILESGDKPHKEESAVQGILTGRLTKALQEHGEALGRAANASNNYSGRVVWATWALVLAAVVQIIVIWCRG